MGTSQYKKALFIDGEWERPDAEIEVADLAHGGVFASIAAATPEQVERAIAAAHDAKELMGETTIVQRSRWLEATATAIAARKADFVDVIVREAGKPISSARGEVTAAVERFRLAAEEARAIRGEYIEGTTVGHEGWEAIVKPEPIGSVLAIAPFNYPLLTTALHVAPALAAGNSVVLKPSSNTPISGAIFAECIAEADIPKGAFNFVPGESSEIGDILTGDDRFNAIAMTGSSSAGRHLAKESRMARLHLELGGNAPALVFPDADLDNAVAACARGSFKYAGQRCSAVSRVLAHESVHDSIVDRFDADMDSWIAGDLFDEETTIGPLISEEQVDWVVELVDDAIARGAHLVRGGEPDGIHYSPTLLSNVPHDARIIHEEQFGPVAAVASVESEDEAVALANVSELALDAAVFTNDYDLAMRTAERLDAGAVRINGSPSHGLGDIPFGGNKASGIGREGIGYTIDAFTREKSIVL